MDINLWPDFTESGPRWPWPPCDRIPPRFRGSLGGAVRNSKRQRFEFDQKTLHRHFCFDRVTGSTGDRGRVPEAIRRPSVSRFAEGELKRTTGGSRGAAPATPA